MALNHTRHNCVSAMLKVALVVYCKDGDFESHCGKVNFVFMFFKLYSFQDVSIRHVKKLDVVRPPQKDIQIQKQYH